RDHWTSLFAEHIKTCQYQRIVLTDSDSLLRNDCEPVCVHVLRKSNIGVVFFDCRTKVTQIFSHGFRGAREEPVRYYVKRNHFHTQGFEQLRTNQRTGAVASVEYYTQLLFFPR